MRINPRRFFELFFFMMLCACLLMLYLRGIESQRAKQTYREAALLVNTVDAAEPSQLPPNEPFDDLPAAMDLSPLRIINADVVYWIEIPDVLSYPVLQGTDNAYYLTHAWDGVKNATGAIFLDCLASPDLTDFHTRIYGHRMRDSSMFNRLKLYADADFWRQHPSVYLSDESGTRRYDIFAAYEVGVNEIVYRQDFPGAEERQELIQFGLEHSVIETDITPTPEDRIITLSTCTGSGHRSIRWVVQAVLCQEV